MFRRKEKAEKKRKEKNEKKGFFKKKNKVKEKTSNNQNSQMENQILKNQLKNELVREVNAAFINNLRAEIKRDLKVELKKEIMSQINEEVLNSIKIGLKKQIKNELREELKEEIRKDILLDLQIKDARERNLREKIAKNNKKVEPIRVSDEDLIRHFLASEEFKEAANQNKVLEQSLILEIKKEIPKEKNIKKEVENNNVKKEIAIARTEVMIDEGTARLELDRTQVDMSSYKDEDIFFEELEEIKVVDDSFKGSIKAFAKEQGENIKKAGSDIKVISKKGYEISKEEIERIKNSEAFKNYANKIRQLKNKK